MSPETAQANRERAAKWRIDNLERARANDRRRGAEKRAKARGGRPPRVAVVLSAEEKKAKAKTYMREWVAKNAEKVIAKRRERAAKNRLAYNARLRRWHAENPGYEIEMAAARRTRVPKWVRRRDCLGFYQMAKRVSACLGIKHHVDHYIPLQGRDVSGLHVPWNLRVIPAVVNMRKHNRVEA